jgi:hypothetical protein
MTELAQSIKAVEPAESGEVADLEESTQQTEPGSPAPRRFAGIGDWPGIVSLTCGVVVGLAIGWFIVLSPGEVGSKAEWFFGAGAFCAVAVAIWQTLKIQHHATQSAAEAAERLRKELAAAEQRTTRELALTQASHQAEMEARQTLHRAEMEAQRELARVDRIHLLAQLQQQAMIAVSRAVNAHAHVLATLWNEGASILLIEDREAREQAMNPIFEQIGQVVNDFSVELANAHLLIEDDRLHQALLRVNSAVLMAIRVAEDVHVAVAEGSAPDPNPIPAVQRLMHETAAEARHLAWELLRTGLDNGGPQA